MEYVNVAFGVAGILWVLYSCSKNGLWTVAGHESGPPTSQTKRQKSIEAKKFQQMNEYKSMYHKLQNLEDFAAIVPAAKQLLLSFLDAGLSMARYRERKQSILSIEEFAPDALEKFLQAELQAVLDDFESYSERRSAGCGPELFKTHEEALNWLKCRAPMNFIDGAWLCRVHKITTPFFLRAITKDSWQTLSEELGDGAIDKNHIFIYRKLLRDSGIILPDADSVDFLHPRHGMGQEQIWRSAVGQLLISLFSNDFLPEILGFNLHFESLSGSDLKAARELPEFGLSAYYYTLHISIDNADSGHSAMALETIIRFMNVVRQTGVLNYQKAWKRIQAGYLLSQSLEDDLTAVDYEDKLVEMLRRKANLAKQMHCNSKTHIGRRRIMDWFSLAMNIGSSDDAGRQTFIDELAGSKPWIYRGNSEKSLLVQELAWKGRMFGAFTASETRLLCAWIDSLPCEGDVTPMYWKRVGGFETVGKVFSPSRHDVAVTHPVFPPQPRRICRHSPIFTPHSPLQQATEFSFDALIKLWFVHSCLLENAVAIPYQTVTKLSSLTLQLLRADMGYYMSRSGVAGIDEQQCPDRRLDIISIGLSMARKHSIQEPTCLGDVIDELKRSANDVDAGPDNSAHADATSFAYALLSWSMRPKQNQVFLLGLARAFLDLEAWVAKSDGLLSKSERSFLQRIVDKKSNVFEECLEELGGDEVRLCEYVDGYEYGRAEIEKNVALFCDER